MAVTWRDFAVPGGGGDAAMNALHARVDAGKPPTAAQIKGPAIQDWGRKGVLADLDDVAAAGDWDVKLPRTIANSLVPSFAHKMAQSEAKVATVQAVVAKLWDDDAYAGAKAQADLAAAVAAR